MGRRPWLAGAGVLLATALLPRSAHAAVVRGKVTGFQYLLNPVWAEAKSPDKHGYSFREPVPTVRSEFRKLFPHIPKELCIAAIAVEKQKREPLLVRVGGGRTTPVTVVVPPGTELQFKNTDPFTHRLYAVGFPAFGAADTIKGGDRRWTVPEPKTFEIRDGAAPSLRMWVVGEPNVASIAYPSLSGDFALGIPGPGEYKIQAYFAGKRIGPEIPVTIAERDLVLPQPLVVGTKEAASDSDKD